MFGFIGGLGKLAMGMVRTPFKAARLAKGPVGLGLSALLPGKWGGLKYAIPAVGLGLYGLGKIGYGLVGGAYSPYRMVPGGMSQSYENTPMEFGTFRRSYLDYNATGSLAFALHNRR